MPLWHAHQDLVLRLQARRAMGAVGHLLNLQVHDAELRSWIAMTSEALQAGHDLDEQWWGERVLPLLVVATEVGFRYRGSGHAYWEELERTLTLPQPLSEAERGHLARRFETWGNPTGVRPSKTPWEVHFRRIAWPIAHALLPASLHLHFALAVERFTARHGAPEPNVDLTVLGREFAASVRVGAPPLLGNVLSSHALAGELVASLLRPATPARLLHPAVVERLRRDLDGLTASRRALNRARSVRPKTTVAGCAAPMLSWDRMKLAVDFRPVVAGYSDELDERGWDVLTWAGGSTWLGQLAILPVEVSADLPLASGPMRLIPVVPTGLSASLHATLECATLDLGARLLFAAPEGGDDVVRVGPRATGVHRLLVRDPSTAPAGGRRLDGVAGLACLEYRTCPVGVGPVERAVATLLTPPDLRGRAGRLDRELLPHDAVVLCEPAPTPRWWLLDDDVAPVRLESGEAVVPDVQRRPARSWHGLKVRVDRANTAALRSRRMVLHLGGSQGVGPVAVTLSLTTTGGVLLARVSTWLEAVPVTLEGHHPVVRALADAAHDVDPGCDLILSLSTGLSTLSLEIDAVTVTAWGRDEGRRTEIAGAIEDLRAAGDPLRVAPPGAPFVLRHFLVDDRPVLGSGEIRLPSSLVLGAVVQAKPPEVLGRTLDGWGGSPGPGAVVDAYLAWATAVPGPMDRAHHPVVWAAQREVVRWLDEQLTRALCGDLWLGREQAARAAWDRVSTRLAQGLLAWLRAEEDNALIALEEGGVDPTLLVEPLATRLMRHRDRFRRVDDDLALIVGQDVTALLDDALRDAGLFKAGEVEADVDLDASELKNLINAADPWSDLDRLAALIRPPGVYARLREPRAWHWMEPDDALRLLDGADAPAAVVRVLLLAWHDPHLLVLDDPVRVRAAVSAGLADRDLARAIRWVAIHLRGDLHGSG